MQSTEVYSDSSCKSAVSLTITSSTSCASVDCASATIAGTDSTYYTATSCPSSIYKYTEDVYGDTEYLLVDIYSGTDCATYVESAAFAALGACEVAGTDGQSVIASLHSNGSAQVAYYLDGSCTLSASTSVSITDDDLTAHSCSQGRKYYSSSATGVGSSATSSSASSSGSTDRSSGLGGGAIAGMIVGVLFVLALIGILVYRRCRRRNQGQAPTDLTETNDLRDAHYAAVGSPAKARRQTTTTTISDSDRPHPVKLWDDDVIVAARIPREKVKLIKLINRGGPEGAT
ncbi:hypothetical protein PHYPSEUDO_005918 [Phytophthora pseudosyringae]|uniref:Uncharacterized protein n=1 Tax=Phytophthora pseudosyringae TaxID=221518 RepID=A0A8T1VMZ7_9STRA|nr:hypothetical protein PHYPSEUDO_005918 [Phytophthora pseudosyringae]